MPVASVMPDWAIAGACRRRCFTSANSTVIRIASPSRALRDARILLDMVASDSGLIDAQSARGGGQGLLACEDDLDPQVTPAWESPLRPRRPSPWISQAKDVPFCRKRACPPAADSWTPSTNLS